MHVACININLQQLEVDFLAICSLCKRDPCGLSKTLVLLYKMTVKRSNIWKWGDSKITVSKGLWAMCKNASLTSGKEFHASHADLFVFPNKEDVLSHPVKVSNAGKQQDLSLPRFPLRVFDMVITEVLASTKSNLNICRGITLMNCIKIANQDNYHICINCTNHNVVESFLQWIHYMHYHTSVSLLMITITHDLLCLHCNYRLVC